MKGKHLIPAGLMAVATVVAAGEIKNAASFTPPPPAWSISAGVTVRAINADFHVARPAPLPTPRFFRAGSAGAGDVGLYTGGAGTVRYADGSVGPDYGLNYSNSHTPTGDAGGLIDSTTQLISTGRIDSFDVPIDDLAFYSSETFTRYGSTAALHGLDVKRIFRIGRTGVAIKISLTHWMNRCIFVIPSC